MGESEGLPARMPTFAPAGWGGLAAPASRINALSLSISSTRLSRIMP
eukprot:CAMPEP_0173360946 /NCGR_PEP_ID=MMETSP1144-20121109/20900_1 /TAXON_ID=483371 /ORGANISM="non described non described, Strain CCMP2298" /LENGTH=46 /DNA_ID= /DNA_START= /DNA_END= /DNA_ORIENTATION=